MVFWGCIIAGQFEAHKTTRDVVDTPIAVLMSFNQQQSADFSKVSVVCLYEKMAEFFVFQIIVLTATKTSKVVVIARS